jgi:hypothetical protein
VWPRLAPAPVRREGRFLGGCELYTGAEGGHQLGPARRRCGRFGLAHLWGGGQEGTVGKLCHPGRERRLHDSGVDIPQGILGAKRTLRPSSGFVLRGKATEFGQEPVAQRGGSLRSEDLLGRRPRLAVLREGAKGPSRSRPFGRAVSVELSQIEYVSRLCRALRRLSGGVRRIEVILSGNSD